MASLGRNELNLPLYSSLIIVEITVPTTNRFAVTVKCLSYCPLCYWIPKLTTPLYAYLRGHGEKDYNGFKGVSNSTFKGPAWLLAVSHNDTTM